MSSGTYFQKDSLSSIRNYKGGSTIDHSLLYRFIISPLCNKIVKLLPSWLAPNVLTFCGFLCNVAAFFTIYMFVPNFVGEAPSWSYLLSAFFMVLYVFMDNMDGKQSFRTGSSSPFGELFDHGCDSAAIAIGICSTATVIQGGPWVPILWTAVGFPAFYLAHWEELYNHHLILGMINGPTEAEALSILLYIITPYLGPSFWISPITTVGGYDIIPNQVVTYGVVAMTSFTLLQSLYGGLQSAKKNNVKALEALSRLVPVGLFCIFAYGWVLLSPNTYLANPQLFLVMLNCIFTYLVVNIILERMCKLPHTNFFLSFIPVIFGFMNSLKTRVLGSPFVDELMLAHGIFAFYFIFILHFIIVTSQDLCQILKIKMWTIKYPNKATKKQ